MKVKIGGTEYEAYVGGNIVDRAWDGRNSKTILLEMTHAAANELFVDNAEWSIIYQVKDPDTGEISDVEEDNSAFCVAGDIIDHRDGTISVKMGKPTDLEEILELLYGGDEE